MTTKTKNEPRYIESTTAGKTWRIDTFKPVGGQPYTSAIEGVKGPGYFECAYGNGPGASRLVRVPLPTSRITAKAHAVALDSMEAQLRTAGCIA